MNTLREIELFGFALPIPPRTAVGLKAPLTPPIVEIKRLDSMMPLVREGVIIQTASRIDICDWGLIMERTTQASVGTDPWTMIQNRLHPVVAEREFAPLDWSYLSSSEPVKQRPS
jgi:hypothetical protein